MATNAKNLAELLNTDSTVAAGDVADGSITTAKLADNSITIDKLNNNLALGGNDTGGTPFTITLPQGVGGTDWSTYAPITRSSSGATGDGYEVVKSENDSFDNIKVLLKYVHGSPVINEISRVSKPGRRIYTRFDSLPRVQNGLGVAIISTSFGILTDNEAREKKVGGEIICNIS